MAKKLIFRSMKMNNFEEILLQYGIKGEVAEVVDGPLLKQIKFLPAAGTKMKNIVSALPDIARQIGAQSLRAEPAEEGGYIFFQLPQKEPKTIDFAQIMNDETLWEKKGKLPICLGVDTFGKPYFADLAKMPHLLVAGTTGSGKSVGLNTFILSLMKAKKPSELKFVLIDPKRVEFSLYNNQRYMLMPVVGEMSQASAVLAYLVEQMEKRYALLEENMCKNIGDYNENCGNLPYIVCIIDEFSDLIASDKKVEGYIQRLAQKARAAGIHIILATQRPSVDVVTGVLKANFPTRLAYKVASSADSRTILDTVGAEDLIGRGDALYLASDGQLKRIHGAYIDDKKIAEFLEPLRTTIKPIALPQNQNDNDEEKSDKKTEKSKKSWWRKVLDFWESLRQKDKKIIINMVFALFEFLFGTKEKEKKKKLTKK